MADHYSVHFRRSEVTATWDGTHESILELAEAHGVDIPYSCRCGLDTVCQTPLLKGKIRYPEEPMAEPDEGTFLACVAVPESDLEIDA